MIKNRSTKKLLNKSGPNIEPFGTPDTISVQVLSGFLVFIPCFLFVK